MRRAIPWTVALALSVLLGACADGGRWSKDGTPPEQVSDDYAQCRHEAQRDIQRDVNIDTDIAAGRQHDWDQSQTSQAHQANNASNNQKLSRDIVKACMEARGYTPTGRDPNDGPNWVEFLD